jgi:hypothetical protein
MRRELGPVQKHILGILARSDHGTWHRGAGWYFDCHSVMIRTLESLRRYGLVERFYHPRHPVAYRITTLGRNKGYE